MLLQASSLGERLARAPIRQIGDARQLQAALARAVAFRLFLGQQPAGNLTISAIDSGLEIPVCSLLAGDIHVRTNHFARDAYDGGELASSASFGVRLVDASVHSPA